MERDIPDYQIDRKLKEGKDYPSDLLELIDLFKNPVPWIGLGKTTSRKSLEEYYGLLSAEKIEKIPMEKRKDYVVEVQKRFDLGPSGTGNYHFKMGVSSIEKIFKAFFLVGSPEAIKNSLRKINKKLEYFHPVVRTKSVEGLPQGIGFSLDFAVKASDFRWRKDFGLIHTYWICLARAMQNLDRRIVHQCPYCKKIFFSKQRKKYHPECRSKDYSKKAVKSGFAKKWQKAYRDRLKKKEKTR